MANHQINITENGTKTLKTAGKYCDRDIDVVVDVPSSVQTPNFTNILTLPTTIIKNGYRCISSGYSETVDGVAIVCACKAGTHRIRVRGKYVWGFLQTNKQSSVSPYYTNFYQASSIPSESTFAGTTITDNSVTSANYGQDAYGDFFTEFTMPSDVSSELGRGGQRRTL